MIRASVRRVGMGLSPSRHLSDLYLAAWSIRDWLIE